MPNQNVIFVARKSSHESKTCSVDEINKENEEGATIRKVKPHEDSKEYMALNKPFKCDDCDQRFLTKILLNKHKLLHFDKDYFSCNYCGKTFLHKSSHESKTCSVDEINKENEEGATIRKVKPHEDSKEYMALNKPFKCDDCDQRFLTKILLNKHKLLHFDKDYFSCNYCGKTFLHKSSHESKTYSVDEINKENEEGATIRKVKPHEDSKEYMALNKINKTFKCDDCNQCFLTKILLNKHKLLHFDKDYFSCNYCGKTFPHKYKLRRHIVTHSTAKPFSCPICKKQFKRKDEVIKHNRTVHQGKKYNVYKSYKCSLCPKAFTHLAALEDHQFVHTGQKSHLCTMCPAIFASKGGLQYHIKVFHDGQKRPQKSCQCEVCGKSYSSTNAYNAHMRLIHGDAKPKCDICGKKVSSKQFLAVHMNMHTGEKPYCCEHCGKSFANNKVLIIHVRTHTGESPYVCSICPKSFKQRSALTGHYKSKHPGKKP
ncbi:hypothetical protein M8J77_024248 [Diaphorina citri]|nr:hypothetical protein M8J77_024248 [Diaphorina citri]